jgi:hypothetical protein
LTCDSFIHNTSPVYPGAQEDEAMDIKTFGRAVGRLAAAAGLAITMSAIALPALSGVARADGCSNATLKGEYAFGGTVYAPPPSIGVFEGVKVYDGNDHFTQRDYLGNNLAGPDFAPPGQEQGTYTVNSDCTGSDTLNLNAPVPVGSTGVISVKFVISDGGRHVHEVVSEYTPPGANGPVPIQTSVDVWKVAPAQDQDD